jgi:hypothetical protein
MYKGRREKENGRRVEGINKENGRRKVEERREKGRKREKIRENEERRKEKEIIGKGDGRWERVEGEGEKEKGKDW